MNVRKLSTVNSVGPTSGSWESTFLSPGDAPKTHGPILVITLTALDKSFTNHSFIVDAPLSNQMLAVGLAAISTGNEVLADVDWPPPVIGIQKDGKHSLLGPAYCHSLWLTAG